MAITAASLILHVVHPVSGADPSGLPPSGGSVEAMKLQIVNEAGRLLYNAHPWKFRERAQGYINFAAPIDIADGTWTESSKTLTKTGAFANYTWAAGDVIEITDGTGATSGDYPIASKTSSDAIVLADSIGSGADGQADIDGTLSFPYAALPSDFGQEINIRADGLTIDFEMVDFGTLAEMRDSSIMPAGFHYYGAIEHPSQATQTTAFGNPRLAIHPAPTAAVVKALTIWYRAKWRELTATNQYAAIPDAFETLLHLFIRAVSEGYQNAHGEEGGFNVVVMDERIEEIMAKPIFKSCVREDGLRQSNYGVVGPGLIGSMGSGLQSVVRASSSYDVWPQASPWVS